MRPCEARAGPCKGTSGTPESPSLTTARCVRKGVTAVGVTGSCQPPRQQVSSHQKVTKPVHSALLFSTIPASASSSSLRMHSLQGTAPDSHPSHAPPYRRKRRRAFQRPLFPPPSHHDGCFRPRPNVQAPFDQPVPGAAPAAPRLPGGPRCASVRTPRGMPAAASACRGLLREGVHYGTTRVDALGLP